MILRLGCSVPDSFSYNWCLLFGGPPQEFESSKSTRATATGYWECWSQNLGIRRRNHSSLVVFHDHTPCIFLHHVPVFVSPQGCANDPPLWQGWLLIQDIKSYWCKSVFSEFFEDCFVLLVVFFRDAGKDFRQTKTILMCEYSALKLIFRRPF